MLPDERYFEVFCKCALGEDTTVGYMGNITGTEKYNIAISLKKEMLESSNCHTLDRDNYEAQLDCNQDLDFVPQTTEAMFGINNWVYMQDPDVADCINLISKNSYINMVLEDEEKAIKNIDQIFKLILGVTILMYQFI